VADPRFFGKVGPFSAGDIADAIGARVEPPEQAGQVFTDTGPLGAANSDTLSFLDNTKYLASLAQTKAGGVVIHPDYADRVPDGTTCFLSELPYRAFALAVQKFYPEPSVAPSVHPSASVASDARIGSGVRIDAGAVIEEDVDIGDDCWIGPNVVVERGVRIGAKTRIGSGVCLAYCIIGADCRIHAGSVIGTRGFGFAMDRQGHIDLPQLGRVVIGNGVEIGGNCTIDRGMSDDTTIGDGTKIDNLVQIGHNVSIGKGCVLCAQTGIAGSAVLEDYVVTAGQVGIGPHMRVGMGAQLAAKSGAWRDIAPGEKVGGVPAVKIRDWHRQNATVSRLSRAKRNKMDND
jgi:UDP-3-O-[3-hydroxymyristoyl] glucosamine N-acyltransferase